MSFWALPASARHLVPEPLHTVRCVRCSSAPALSTSSCVSPLGPLLQKAADRGASAFVSHSARGWTVHGQGPAHWVLVSIASRLPHGHPLLVSSGDGKQSTAVCRGEAFHQGRGSIREPLPPHDPVTSCRPCFQILSHCGLASTEEFEGDIHIRSIVLAFLSRCKKKKRSHQSWCFHCPAPDK